MKSNLNPSKNLLVIGAGYLGKRVAHFAVQVGWRVTAARRRLPLNNDDPAISWIAMDVTDLRNVKDKLEQLCLGEQPTAAVYCVSAGESVESAYRNAYEIGIRNVVSHLPQSTRLLFVSSTGVYHQNSGEFVDEQSPLDATRLPATQSCLIQGETIVKHRPNSIVARLSGIYGPGRTRMIALAQAISAPYVVTERAYTNRIHVDDGARAILHLLDIKTTHDTYCVTDQEPSTQSEVLLWIRDAMAMPPVSPEYRQNQKTLPNDHELPATNKKISNRRLLETGFELQFPTFREGFSKLL